MYRSFFKLLSQFFSVFIFFSKLIIKYIILTKSLFMRNFFKPKYCLYSKRMFLLQLC